MTNQIPVQQASNNDFVSLYVSFDDLTTQIQQKLRDGLVYALYFDLCGTIVANCGNVVLPALV